MIVGQEHGFKEIVLRAPGRYDMQWKIDGNPHFLHDDKVLSTFMPFVREIDGLPRAFRWLTDTVLSER